MRTWIKLYTEILRDPKIHRLADKQFRACINLFALAGLIDEDGLVGTVDDIQFHLRLDRRETVGVLSCLVTAKILYFEAPNYRVIAFARRQEKPPSQVKESILRRVQAHRARKKGLLENGNEDVTSLHVRGNEPVTPPEVEVDTDTDTEKKLGADKPRKPERARDLHFENLSDVCGMTPEGRNWRLLPKTSAGQLNKFAAELRVVGATPEQLLAFGPWWYANDWRGKKGQPPKPANVVQEWTHFLNGDSKPTGAPAAKRLAKPMMTSEEVRSEFERLNPGVQL